MAIVLETIGFSTLLFCEKKLFKIFSCLHVYVLEKPAEMILEKSS